MIESASILRQPSDLASRRDFLVIAGSAGLVMTAALAGITPARAQETADGPADALFFGGVILTMNDAQPTVEAVAVKDGRIIAAGSLTDIEKSAGADTVRHDLKGRTMLPGFFDPHSHANLVGMQAISANLLPPPDGKGESIAALQEIYRAWIEANGEFINKFGIIMGFGYDDAQLAEGRHPTRQDLDEISTELPVIAMHQSMHLGVVNSKALELAKVTAETPDPSGGVFRREAGTNAPNGVLEENAFVSMLPLFLGRLDEEANLHMARAGVELYARFGYTTCQDAYSSAGNLALFKTLGERGELPIDVLAFPGLLTSADTMKPPLLGPDYINHLRIGGVKLTLDGSPQGKTAWLSQPYYVPPAGRGPEYAGYPQIEPALAIEKIEQAFREGWQIQVHGNGDAAIDLFLAGVKSALQKTPRVDHRAVLIHGQTAREDQVDTMKELGVIPSFFPMHTFYWGDWHRDSVLGPVRAENISPTGWAYRRGMRFTSHHDAPVANPDSIRVLSATVTRRTRSGDILGAHQRVSPEVALKAMTLWAAWQHYEEDRKGSIEVGKLADFVVLSENPVTIPPEQLASLQVIETIKEGTTVYRKP
jgi:predicted amidohydrolase YtcJ